MPFPPSRLSVSARSSESEGPGQTLSSELWIPVLSKVLIFDWNDTRLRIDLAVS
jgi:hypothetical protein